MTAVMAPRQGRRVVVKRIFVALRERKKADLCNDETKSKTGHANKLH
jgi:hypothetical protein